MARSTLGNKATRTGKCKCNNHQWSIFEKRETSAHDVVITTYCSNCDSLWDTKSITDEILSMMADKDIQWYKQVLSKKIESENKSVIRLTETIQETEKERNKTLVNIEKLRDKLDSI